LAGIPTEEAVAISCKWRGTGEALKVMNPCYLEILFGFELWLSLLARRQTIDRSPLSPSLPTRSQLWKVLLSQQGKRLFGNLFRNSTL
jgi:hypothetical protein